MVENSKKRKGMTMRWGLVFFGVGRWIWSYINRLPAKQNVRAINIIKNILLCACGFHFLCVCAFV